MAFYVWIHRENETDPGSDGVIFLIVNEVFSIGKNIFQVPVPDEDANDVSEISHGTYVMNLGGSKKTLRLQGRVKGSDINDVISKYSYMKAYLNNLEIGSRVVFDICNGYPSTDGSGNLQNKLYEYRGVVADVVFRYSEGRPAILEIDLTAYIGEVL